MVIIHSIRHRLAANLFFLISSEIGRFWFYCRKVIAFFRRMQAFNVMPGKPSTPYSIASTGSRIGAFMLDAVLMTIYFAVMAVSFLNSDVDDFSIWMSFVVAPPLL